MIDLYFCARGQVWFVYIRTVRLRGLLRLFWSVLAAVFGRQGRGLAVFSWDEAHSAAPPQAALYGHSIPASIQERFT